MVSDVTRLPLGLTTSPEAVRDGRHKNGTESCETSSTPTGESEGAYVWSRIPGEAPPADETDRWVGMASCTRVVILFDVDGVHKMEDSNEEAEVALHDVGREDATK